MCIFDRDAILNLDVFFGGGGGEKPLLPQWDFKGCQPRSDGIPGGRGFS